MQVFNGWAQNCQDLCAASRKVGPKCRLVKVKLKLKTHSFIFGIGQNKTWTGAAKNWVRNRAHKPDWGCEKSMQQWIGTHADTSKYYSS